MRLTDDSLQKMAQSNYEGEIYFGKAEESGEILSKKYPFAHILLLLSIKTADKFSFFQKLFPNAVIIVLLPSDGAERLFAVSDDIALTVCYGEDYVVCASRYFSSVRDLPCAVFAFDARSAALSAAMVQITVGGERGEYPTKRAELLFADTTLLNNDFLFEAYIQTVSVAVGLFELKFDGLILASDYKLAHFSAAKEAAASCLQTPFAVTDRRKIFCAALNLAMLNEKGFPCGEVKILSETYRRLGAGAMSGFYAMDKLAKIYHVFFTCGTYRKYYTPPYHVRVRQAAALYKKREEEISAAQILPDTPTLASYSDVLESVRPQFLKDAEDLLKKTEWLGQTLEEKKTAYPMENKVLNAALKYLPEGNKNYGITSLMRDFGLFDF